MPKPQIKTISNKLTLIEHMIFVAMLALFFFLFPFFPISSDILSEFFLHCPNIWISRFPITTVWKKQLLASDDSHGPGKYMEQICLVLCKLSVGFKQADTSLQSSYFPFIF